MVSIQAKTAHAQKQWLVERAAYHGGKHGESTGAIFLSAELGKKISRREMRGLLIQARKNPVLSRALDAAAARHPLAQIDISEMMQREVERFRALLDFVEARFFNEDEESAAELWAYLDKLGVKLKKEERAKLLDIAARLDLKEAIATAAIASKEARSWLELDLKARRIIPSAPQVNVLNVQQGQTEMLSKLCACCRATVAGLPKPQACDCTVKAEATIDVPPKADPS